MERSYAQLWYVKVFSEVPKNEASANSVFHSAEIFNRTYAEMEQKFKVYIYPDGDPKTFYQTPRKLTGKYASEGYFFQNIWESRFRTDNPEEAHLFFIPLLPYNERKGKHIVTLFLSLYFRW